MLTQEENKLFTSVGPGTPMGELLRRYWQPVGCSEFVTKKPTRVKVMGEDLVLFRGESGKTHLMQLRCAHRSVALDYGRVEGDCIRCPYHGWIYDASGQCLDQPAEPEGSKYKSEIKLKAYKTQEASGIVFGYMGPEPAPLLPLFDLMRETEGVKALILNNVEANFMNHVENIVDVSHLAWLHGYTFPAYGGKKVTYHWERTQYGADNVMQVDGIEDTHRSCYGFPNINRFSGSPVEGSTELVRSMIWRVPQDDVSTLLYFPRFYTDKKHTFRTFRGTQKYGEYRPLEKDWWGIDVSDQDRMAVEQQGVIADRTKENLGASDGGIILMRKLMREALAAVAEGKDPPFVIRDPSKQLVDFQQHKTDVFGARQTEVQYALAREPYRVVPEQAPAK